jgi:hypothetical protein
MFRLLVVPEYYEFLYRSVGLMGLATARTGLAFALLNLAVILFTALWSQPFLLGFAAVYRSAGTNLFGLRSFRRPAALVPLGILLVAGAAWVLRLPSYGRPWEQEVTVAQKYDVAKSKTTVEFSSGDYLRGFRAEMGDRVEEMDFRTCRAIIDYPLEMDWLKASFRPQFTAWAGERLARVEFDLGFEKQPYVVTVKLSSDRPLLVESSNFQYNKKKKRVTMTWKNFPARVLRPEVELRLPADANLNAEIRAVFLETPVRVACGGENMHFVQRSEIVRRIDLRQSGN